jgi:ribose 5-phosphate isomerase B
VNIAIGADHRGFEYKSYIKQKVTKVHNELIVWIDVGTNNNERSDYPAFAKAAVQVMQKKEADYAILICGSGVGMAITANRFTGIFAGVAWNQEIARVSKEDDDTNILVIPSDFVQKEHLVDIVQAWLLATFKEGRYQKRIDMINAIK